jgi:DNA-directed RNA polymerase subunit M/transcription elongation factor TFIIS
MNKYELKIYDGKISKKLEKILDQINRENARNELKKYICWDIFVNQIEQGIFEFTLIFINNHVISYILATDIYQDKLNDICDNLSVNEYIDNKTLKESILKCEIDPFQVAFLPPEKIHPARWNDILTRRNVRETTINNIPTTDLYKCYKCGERKCTITQKQIRAADEPTTTIITCTICMNIFTK